MDRRPRDIPPEDRYGGGQSYRPGNVRNRTPPRRNRDNDSYAGNRSPLRPSFDARGPPRRRSRSPPGAAGFRRSPSPRERFGVPRRGDSYRARPRSPLRRDDGPRDDLFRRNTARDFRDERAAPRDIIRDFSGRSPPPRFRDRSPLSAARGGSPRELNNGRTPQRFRDRSPESAARGGSPFRGRRTPPGPRRDRSPPRRWEDGPATRPYSPVRRQSPRGSDRGFSSRPRSPAGDRQRLRSPSPRGFRHTRDLENRGRESGATSRKSSPPVHASRLALVQDLEEPRSGRPSPRGAGIDNSTRVPQAERSRVNGSPRKDLNGDVTMQDAEQSPEPAREPSRQQLQGREPPSGPSADRPPPTGPGTASRTFAAPPAAPPAGPRGDATATRGGFVPRGRGSYSADYTVQGRGAITATFRGGRGGGSGFGRGSSYDRDSSYQPADNQAGSRAFSASAPRPPVRTTSSVSQAPRPDAPRPSMLEPRDTYMTGTRDDAYRRPPTGPSAVPAGPARDSRSVNDSVHPALRGLPEIVPNGRKLPPIADHTRLNKLEDEAEKLRKIVHEKDGRKRRTMREWDRLVRDGDSAAYRSEVADTSVRAYDSESERAGSAF